MAGVTLPSDTTATTTASTYRTILSALPFTARPLPLTWAEGHSRDFSCAWSLSLPHDLTAGRVSNGPPEAHPPDAGFRKLVIVDPGEAYRHHLAAVYGVRTGGDLLRTVAARLDDAGDADYRELHSRITGIAATPAHRRPPLHRILGPVPAGQQHVVIPFLQPDAALALPNVPPADTTAWDVSVAVHMLWLGYGGGLVTDGQCAPLLERALQRARDTYATWEDYADGLVVGRAVADGRLDDSCLGVVRDVAVALNHPDSPWARFPLHDRPLHG